MNLQSLMNADAAPSSGGAASENVEAAEVVDGSMVTPQTKPVNATALVLLAIILLGSGSTYFMHVRTGPEAATASEPNSQSASATVATFLADGGKTMNNMRQILAGTQKLVEQFKVYPSVAQVPVTDLKTNPFQLSNTQLPPRKETEEITRKKREEARLAAYEATQTLRLQSLMSRGEKRLVMINNVMYQEGDNVDGFLIEKITSSSVIVKQAVFRFELSMAK